MATLKTFPLKAAQSAATATVSRPAPSVYLLTMHNTENGLMDNRLSPSYIKDSLLPALDFIELDYWNSYNKGDKQAALIITGERVKNKFFSNGLDLAASAKVPHFFRDVYYKLLSQLVCFPMPTVAAINGHCFAGGLGLALACDFRVMREERAWLCMNELDFGVALPDGMTGLLEAKLSPSIMRKALLQAHRFTAPEALAVGMVDETVAGDGDAVLAKAIAMGQANLKHSVSGALPAMKAKVWHQALDALKSDDPSGVVNGPATINQARWKYLQEAQRASKL